MADSETLPKGYDPEKYKKPSVAVDVIIFTVDEDRLKVLLVKRGEKPFQGKWALPGGFIDLTGKSKDGPDVSLDQAAMRELAEETGVKAPFLEQVKTYGNATRDPRDWTLSVAYFALIPSDSANLKHGTDASDAKWFSVNGYDVSADLAFDHADILRDAINRLRSKVEYTAIAVHLLPEKFTLAQLQKTFELLLQEKLDKSAFRRRLKAADFLEEIPGEMERETDGRPAQIYKTKGKDPDLFFPRSLVRHASESKSHEP